MVPVPEVRVDNRLVALSRIASRAPSKDFKVLEPFPNSSWIGQFMRGRLALAAAFGNASSGLDRSPD